MSMGVAPASFGVSGSAPNPSNSSAFFRSPNMHAKCSGVEPFEPCSAQANEASDSGVGDGKLSCFSGTYPRGQLLERVGSHLQQQPQY